MPRPATKEKIAVHIDEVLFPFVDEFVKYHNSCYGTDHHAEHFTTYQFDQVLGLELQETIRRVYEFNNQECVHVLPVQDSVDAIEKLGNCYELNIITARHPQHEAPIRRWINRHYGDIFGQIILTGHKDAVENVVTKAQVCREIGAIALIDDSIDHIKLCVSDGVDGLLFGDYPWNQAGELPRGVTRVKHWREVLEHFDAAG
jgi:5'(3')-deoxyribonucleotidase